MIEKYNGIEKPAGLWKDWNETLIWSCLDGSMGSVWAEDSSNPKSAMAIIGDFCFFDGIPSEELVRFKPSELRNKEFIIMAARNPEWNPMIEKIYGTRATQKKRYAIKKEPEAFDREQLAENTKKLPEGFSIVQIDEKLYHEAKKHNFSSDWVSQFKEWKDFKKNGLGFVVLKEGQMVSGASSYSFYKGGFEIELDTKEEFRGQGLAKAVASRMILECLDRGLYPSWDAANMTSVHIAEKLGYHLDHEYICYHVNGW